MEILISHSLHADSFYYTALCGSTTYLYEAEHSVMEDSGRVIFRQNGTDQNSFNKLLRRHQNVEAMATVLYTGLKDLYDSDASPQHKKEQM